MNACSWISDSTWFRTENNLSNLYWDIWAWPRLDFFEHMTDRDWRTRISWRLLGVQQIPSITYALDDSNSSLACFSSLLVLPRPRLCTRRRRTNLQLSVATPWPPQPRAPEREAPGSLPVWESWSGQGPTVRAAPKVPHSPWTHSQCRDWVRTDDQLRIRRLAENPFVLFISTCYPCLTNIRGNDLAPALLPCLFFFPSAIFKVNNTFLFILSNPPDGAFHISEPQNQSNDASE